MRSHLVHAAKEQVPNQFLLIHLAAKTARAFHKPNSCIGKSINQALERIAQLSAPGEREGEMSNYKDGMQRVAEEIAEEQYGKGLSDLSGEKQHEGFNDAATVYVERQIP